MPATSRAQQQFFAIAEHEPGKLRGKMPNMSHQKLHDFAATPTKGLPEHSDRSRRGFSDDHIKAGHLTPTKFGPVWLIDRQQLDTLAHKPTRKHGRPKKERKA